MPIPATTTLPAPTSWDEFEKLVAELCIREWKTPNVQRFGRQGQAQHGVDIVGYPLGDRTRLTCVQCKRYATITWAQIQEAVEEARKFEPPPVEFVITTTAPADAKVQALVLQNQATWPFLVQVRSWSDLHLAITRFPDLVEQFWPGWGRRDMTIPRVRDVILDNEPSSFKRAIGDGDAMRYVFDRDVQIAIVVSDEDADDFEEPWIYAFPANGLPERAARTRSVLITYAGQSLARFDFVLLDGARYLLPLPPAPADTDRVIDTMQHALARIVAQGIPWSYEDGLSTAKIRVVPRHSASQDAWLREG